MAHNVTVFFDESGKIDKQVSLMCGLSLPTDFYTTGKINALNEKLKNDPNYKLHFTDLGSNDYKNHEEAVSVISNYYRSVRINIVSFIKIQHINEEKRRYKNIVDKMIYSKIPERVLYGLLRDYGSFSDIKARLYIEDSGLYRDFQLDKNIKEQLNTHSIYRNSHFWVEKAKLKAKNEEIGIEIVDTILGMVRNIIENRPVTFKDGLPKDKNLWRKKKFIMNMINKYPNFYHLLVNIKYFELTGHSSLEQKNLATYLDLFTSQYELELAAQK